MMGGNQRRPVEGTAEFLLQELYRGTMRSNRIGAEQTTQFVAALELDHSKVIELLLGNPHRFRWVAVKLEIGPQRSAN